MKTRTIYTCQNCGFESGKWLGRCPECDSWNSFVEEVVPAKKTVQKEIQEKNTPRLLVDIKEEESLQRLSTGIEEFDRVLGGGIFPASVTLIAGEPGIGKSTLLLQIALNLQRDGQKVLYVSGEESAQQIKHRAVRLGREKEKLLIFAETDIEQILHQIEKIQPQVVIVDSIQSIYHPELSGAPGNVGQVRECAAALFRAAKQQSFALFLIGHVTKEGVVAGPKVLEHLVDVVLHFEGNIEPFRILRARKNRFGTVNEMAVFEMSATGLRESRNLASLFLNPITTDQPGSCVVCCYEGSRPLLVEVQALVNRSSYGTPQRTVSGIDYRRLALILAILEKYSHLDLGYMDVFVKIAGGLRLDDPGMDLGIAAAIYSSRTGIPVEKDTLFIGELGLSGEVRAVSFIEQRLQQAEKSGFRQAYIPAGNFQPELRQKRWKLMISPVERLEELLLPQKKGSEKHP